MSTIIILEAIYPEEEGHFSQNWQTGRLAGRFYNHSMVILMYNVTLFDPELTTYFCYYIMELLISEVTTFSQKLANSLNGQMDVVFYSQYETLDIRGNTNVLVSLIDHKCTI